jgi:hypothetical protein
MVAELERLAAEMGEGMTAIDYVCERTAGGDTLIEICRDVGKTIGHNLQGGTLSSWINTDQERRAKIQAARAIGAISLAEQGMEMIDDADESREAIAKAKASAEYRQWLASKWNRPMFGADVAQVQVNVSTGSLLLDALRQRQVTAVTQPILPPAGPDVELVIDG